RLDLVARGEERADLRLDAPDAARPRRSGESHAGAQPRGDRLSVASDIQGQGADVLFERGLLLELFDHRGKRAGEDADLVLGIAGKPDVLEVPDAHFLGALDEASDGPRDPPRQKEGKDERDREGSQSDADLNGLNRVEGPKLFGAAAQGDRRADELVRRRANGKEIG